MEKYKSPGASLLNLVITVGALFCAYGAAHAQDPYMLALYLAVLIWAPLDEIASIMQLKDTPTKSEER